MKNTYIVTGGAGFIGSAMISKLNAEGISDIIVVDELGSTDKWRNLAGKSYIDYLHKDQFLKLVEEGGVGSGVAAVIHMGACSSTTERNAEFLMQNNFRYSKTIAEWCLSKDIRFVYASSAATYGAGEQGYSDDHAAVADLRPLNMYGYSKQAFDLWAITTGAISQMAGIKFFNVYGPNEYHKEEMRSMVRKSWEQIKNTGKVRLFKSHRAEYPDGGQKRDFIYIKDCVDVMWWLTQHPAKNGVYNLGSGTARSWNDLVHGVFAALGKKASIEYIDMPDELRSQYQYFTEAKMGKLSAAGYKGRFSSLEDGIKDYVVNYLEREDPYL